ncbi:MAG TPA: hypothetical protein VEY12_04230 [Thermoplasmata archaeon]|nr:hypothetical protein [Thermoplasmata archaeon]
MAMPLAQTEFVRRALQRRPSDGDEAYSRDILLLERLARMRPLGLASSMTLANLVSRYPREADAIAQELGLREFEPLEDERIRMLDAERLRLAELRQRLGHAPAAEFGSLFEY